MRYCPNDDRNKLYEKFLKTKEPICSFVDWIHVCSLMCIALGAVRPPRIAIVWILSGGSLTAMGSTRIMLLAACTFVQNSEPSTTKRIFFVARLTGVLS